MVYRQVSSPETCIKPNRRGGVVGGVVIGDIPSWRVDHMPYGGVKDSGIGREGIRYAIEDMTEPRLMIIRKNQ